MQFQFVGHICAGFGADKLVQPNRQFSLAGSGEGFKQQFGHAQPQHTITEKFEALVIALCMVLRTGMRQRLHQIVMIAKAIADACLDPLAIRLFQPGLHRFAISVSKTTLNGLNRRIGRNGQDADHSAISRSQAESSRRQSRKR